MTISLEEHVARAIKDVVWDSPAIAVLGHDFRDREAYRTEFVASVTRAAIAAVREYGARADDFETARELVIGYANNPNMGAALHATAAALAAIRESERAACEVIVREMAEHAEHHDTRGSCGGARQNQFAMAYDRAADAIAARKGKG